MPVKVLPMPVIATTTFLPDDLAPIVRNAPQLLLRRLAHGIREYRDLLRNRSEDDDGVARLVVQRASPAPPRRRQRRCRGSAAMADKHRKSSFIVSSLAGSCASAVGRFDLPADVLAGRYRRISGRHAGRDAAFDALHLHGAVRVDEERDGVPVAVASNRPHAMHGGAEAAVGPSLHQIAGVDDDCVLDRRREAPRAVCARAARGRPRRPGTAA